MDMDVIVSFKIVYLNVWGWSVGSKHVAYIDKTNKNLSWLTVAPMSVLIRHAATNGWTLQNKSVLFYFDFFFPQES